MDESRHEAENIDGIWRYLQHADNLHAGRINFSLVAESMLVVSFVTARGYMLGDFILISISILGLIYTVGWWYVNVRLDKRKVPLHKRLKDLDPIYEEYLESGFQPISASFVLSWLLPAVTILFWIALLIWVIAK